MTNNDVSKGLSVALEEIGIIKPVWSDEDESYVYYNALYPCCVYAGDTVEEAVAGYMVSLACFIEHRLEGTVADFMMDKTIGKAGKTHNEIP